MKRIIIALILVGIIYVLVQIVFSDIKTFSNGASALMSGVHKNEVETIIRKYYNTHVLTDGKMLSSDAKILLTPTYLNTDHTTDIVARVESNDTCGGGGCITTLFLHNDDTGEFEPIEFTYAVKEIAVLESVTNGMHDIKINNDAQMTLIWDGNRYSMNTGM